jgi:hypothetical protein
MLMGRELVGDPAAGQNCATDHLDGDEYGTVPTTVKRFPGVSQWSNPLSS